MDNDFSFYENVKIKREYSFKAKLMLSKEEDQFYFHEFEQYCKSYGLTCRYSFECFTVSKHLKVLAIAIFKGKQLNINFALDLNSLDAFKFKNYKLLNVSNFAKYENTPARLKIKSRLALRRAFEILDYICSCESISKKPRYKKKEFLPEKSVDIENLIDEKLIKIKYIYRKDIVFSNVFLDPEDIEEFEEIIDQKGNRVIIGYNYSFLARYIQSEFKIKNYFNEIKEYLCNCVLTIQNSWKMRRFFNDNGTVAIIRYLNKSLYLFLKLDPSELDENVYNFTDVSNIKKYKEYPVRIKLHSHKSVVQSKELIDYLAEKEKMCRIISMFKEEVYDPPYEDRDKLISKKLIKVIKSIPKK